MPVESILTSGDLYFIRETDVLSDELSPYTKIGIVKLDRGSSKRKKEHQTGNPRNLVLAHVVTTDCVGSAEKYLHWRYVGLGVRGEWFKFNNQQLGEAVSYAESIRDNFASRIDSLRKGSELRDVESDDSIQAPSDEARHWLHEYHVAHLISSDADKARTLFNDAIKAAAKEEKDVSAAGSVKVEGTSTFDKKSFVAAEEKILAECSPIRIRPSWSVTRAGDAARADSRTSAAAVYIDALIEAVKKLKSGIMGFDEVSQIDFAVLAATNFYGKEKDLSRLHLQAICGSSRAVEGICKWERKAEPVFDIEILKTQYPEIYRKFSVASDRITVNRDLSGQAD
jgi:hypothetical protein